MIMFHGARNHQPKVRNNASMPDPPSPPPLPWQLSWTPPRCQCFQLCYTGDLLSLFKRLPMEVTDASSPWYTYLSKVYGAGTFPMPFDLRQLELFYPGLLPTSTHLCNENPYGTKNRKRIDETPHLPPCEQNLCSGWLRDPIEAENDTRVQRLHPNGWGTGTSHIWTPIQEIWKGDDEDQRDLVSSGANESRLVLTGRHLFVALQRSRTHRPQLHNDHSWVEVMRVQITDEGNNYGCWFWPLKGSGFFVNVGRSIRATNKGALAQQLNTPPHDRYLPNASAAAGYDSFQIYRGGPQYGGHSTRFHVKTIPAYEIALTGPQCVRIVQSVDGLYDKATNDTLNGPCVPVPIRTGWNASRECECDDKASPLLNCLRRDGHRT